MISGGYALVTDHWSLETDMTVDLRKTLQGVKPDYHGAIDFAELAEFGIRPDEVIDFSVNSNPFGPAPSVVEAIQGARVERYPDKECLALRSAISGQIGVPEGQILCGNGSAELMWLVAFGFLSQGDEVLVLGPTFGEYGRNARLMGARVTEWQAKAEKDFALGKEEIAEIEALMGKLGPKIVHVCRPNNPTGAWLGDDVLEQWAGDFGETLFVVDEAYVQFLRTAETLRSLKLDNVIFLRSMTKDYSLAGVRLGYLAGPHHLVDGLRQCRIPWSVSEVAQAAGIAAIEAQSEYEVMWEQLRQEAVRFKQGLSELGYRVVPSPMHYFLMEVENGRNFRERLLREGILVRLCESYGLPNFVRVATQRPEENNRLITKLGESKSGKLS